MFGLENRWQRACWLPPHREYRTVHGLEPLASAECHVIGVIDVVHQRLFGLPDRHIEQHVLDTEDVRAGLGLVIRNVTPDKSGGIVGKRIDSIEVVDESRKPGILVTVLCDADIGLGEWNFILIPSTRRASRP